MRSYKIFFAIIFFAQLSFGQTEPSVIIQCNDCFNVDPETPNITYMSFIYNGRYTTTNMWVRYINWSTSPAGAFNEFTPSGQGTPNYTGKWANSTNTPTKKIKITVTYTHQDSTPKVIFDERVVVVKYIGSIPYMSIPGASPSIPSNGTSTSIPCGVQNITVTVGTPPTDPSATVGYTWTLPSGWSGSSTTNSITLTTTAGTAPGVISVAAKRTDGTKIQTYSVTPTRPEVTNAIISSISWSPDDKPLCTGEQRVLSGTNTQNATTYSWTTTGGTSITGANNQSTVAITGSSNGTLTLTASNVCLISKNKVATIFANTPQLSSSNTLVDGHPNYYPNYTTGSSVISILNGAACETYYWEIFGGSGYLYASSGCAGCNNNFNGITFDKCNSANASTSSNMAVRIRSANRCGQGNDVVVPLQISGGYYRMASPNPSTDRISVEIDETKANMNLQSISLVSNLTTKTVKKIEGKTLSDSKLEKFVADMDVSSLDRGVYYLILNFEGGKSFKEGIILE